MTTDPKQVNMLILVVGAFGIIIIFLIFYGILFFFRKKNKVDEQRFFCLRCMNQVEEHELVEEDGSVICVNCLTGKSIEPETGDPKVAYCPKCSEEIPLMAIQCEHCDYEFDDESL